MSTERSLKILVVHKKSLYQLYLMEHEDVRIEKLLKQNDITVGVMKKSHQEHIKSLDCVVDCLSSMNLSFTLVYRAQLLPVRGFDLVISVGGDGTLLDTSHFIKSTPLFGVNSDPSSSVGHFCAANHSNFKENFERYLAGNLPTMNQHRINITKNGTTFWASALNDVLLAHPIPASTSRFFLKNKNNAYVSHKCSGLWVSTAAGSTAAIHSAGGHRMEPESEHLQYLVREPFLPFGKGDTVTNGFVKPNDHFTVVIKMRRGMLYVDGPHLSLPVTTGDRVGFEVSPEPLKLVTPMCWDCSEPDRISTESA